LAGGLRIKQILSNDGASHTTTKTYKYGAAESGNGTIRSLAYQKYSTVQAIKHPSNFASDRDYSYRVRVFSSALTHAINPNEGSAVTYPIVTEYQDGGAGANGKTVYTFKDDAFDDLLTIPANGKSAQINRYWNRGQLLSKVSYGANALKKYELTNTYATIASGSSPVLGYLVGQTENRLNSTSPNSSGCLENDDNFDPANPIIWQYGLVKMSCSTEQFYDNMDVSKFTTKKTETTYSPTHYQPTEIKEYVSNSIILAKLLWYPQDFAIVPTTASVTGEVNALRSWQQRNRLNVVMEEIDYRKDLLVTSPPFIITGGKFMTFETIATAGVEKAIVPKTVSVIECLWNTFLNTDYSSNFTAAKDLFNPANNTSTIPRNSHHKIRLYFDTY